MTFSQKLAVYYQGAPCIETRVPEHMAQRIEQDLLLGGFDRPSVVKLTTDEGTNVYLDLSKAVRVEVGKAKQDAR